VDRKKVAKVKVEAGLKIPVALNATIRIVFHGGSTY